MRIYFPTNLSQLLGSKQWPELSFACVFNNAWVKVAQNSAVASPFDSKQPLLAVMVTTPSGAA